MTPIIIEEHRTMSRADTETRLTPVNISRLLDCHPSAPVRWIQDGALLSTGERLRLVALRTPGGWRVRREDLDRFLETVTADRLRPDRVPKTEKQGRKRREELARVGAALKDAGF
jgi:hypothetical protein